jgi:parvulin-like peptidyl-prolyl isomerase
MTTSSILLAVVLTSMDPGVSPADGTFAYLKPSVAPVPPDCKGAKAIAGLVQVPMFAGESSACPVARVGAGVITLGELGGALAASHESRNPSVPPGPAPRPDKEFGPALQRLIDVRLITDEAQEMGMADLPEVKAALDQFKERVLRLALESETTGGIKADPAEVERIYRDLVRQWKVKSVLFGKEADAKAFAAAVKKKGASFDALAQEAVAGKKAKGGGEGEWVSLKDAHGNVAKVIGKVGVGQTSGVVPLPDGFAVLQIEAVRYPDDSAARVAAEEASAANQQRAALSRLYDSLVKKYAKVDQALVKKLDWEKKKPGYAALAKDQRAVVTIAGEKPITVADLTAEMSLKFFHGMETPIKEKRVNREKAPALQNLMVVRLFGKEARARKLQDTPAVLRAADEYRRAVLFSTFVERVIVPDVKVTEPDAQRYFEEHKAEYTTPQMYKLDGIAFTTASGAQGAIERLRAGTDFQWMRANAEGQVPLHQRIFPVDVTAVVTASSLPAEMGKAVAGSSNGDYRMYAASGDQFYVIRVVENHPPRVEPYAEAREVAARAVFDDKVKTAIKDYAGKLRAAGNVEIFITRIGN